MPGIDFQAVRSVISIAQFWILWDLFPANPRDSFFRAPCPEKVAPFWEDETVPITNYQFNLKTFFPNSVVSNFTGNDESPRSLLRRS